MLIKKAKYLMLEQKKQCVFRLMCVPLNYVCLFYFFLDLYSLAFWELDCKWSSFFASNSDGWIVECRSRSKVIVKPVMNFNVDIEAFIVNVVNLDPHSKIRPSELEPRWPFTINASININVHHRSNYDYGSWPTFYDSAIRIWGKKTSPLTINTSKH